MSVSRFQPHAPTLKYIDLVRRTTGHTDPSPPKHRPAVFRIHRAAEETGIVNMGPSPVASDAVFAELGELRLGDHHRLALHRVRPPLAGHALGRVRAAVVELDPRPGDEVRDGTGHEHL